MSEPEARPIEPVDGHHAEEVVDARGLSCPMPVLELAKAIGRVEVGARVRLLATDPTAKVDVPIWCRMQRQRLHSQELDDNVWRFEVERVR